MTSERQQFAALLDQMDEELQDAFLEAINDIKDSVTLKDIEEFIEAGDVEGLVDYIGLDPVYFTKLQNAYEGAFQAGGQFQAQLTATLAAIPFSRRHVRAEEIVRQQGGDLVVDISEGVKQGIRTHVEQAIATGRAPSTIAKDIMGTKSTADKSRTGGVLGLTEPQVMFANNARAELMNLDNHYFTRKSRDKKYDPRIRKAIKNGTPLPAEEINKIIKGYEQKLLRMRAEVIARTEAHKALNAGRYEAMAQNAEAAGVPLDQIKVKWQSIPDGRVRDTHRLLNAVEVDYGQPFTTFNQNLLKYPGDDSFDAPGEEVINCRCTVTFRIEL